MSDSKTALAVAMAGGYLLGRTKKAKLAFAVGSYLAGRRIGLSPGDLLSQGLGGLQQAPQIRELTEQLRGELLTAGRAAATAAANRRLTGLADSLRDRTDALTGEGRRDDRDEEGPDEDAEDEDAYFDEEDEEEDREPEPESEPAPRRRTAKKAPPRKAAPPAKKTAKKAAKKTAKSTAKKTAPAKKAAPAKKTASSRRRGGGRG
ncbi:hypothetical protein ACIBSR_05340 [Streptomyces sp. NPDC049936]|uniref:hypothetical protein n=1 Tax=Streptomyces sp. NPDC049936 TaxID=3365599 RepID=UPI0037918585